MDDTLYDEFGNYIGPELDLEDDDDEGYLSVRERTPHFVQVLRWSLLTGSIMIPSQCMHIPFFPPFENFLSCTGGARATG